MKNLHTALFQSFIADKIICLDESNIYSISRMESNVLSEILEVVSSELLHLPGEIIIIDLQLDNLPQKKRFCIVEKVQMKFSQDFGHEAVVGARCVDENASSYTNLIKSIEII